jgi:hypothetical protein
LSSTPSIIGTGYDVTVQAAKKSFVLNKNMELLELIIDSLEILRKDFFFSSIKTIWWKTKKNNGALTKKDVKSILL